MPAPDSVLKLCETFADHREHFRSGNYNEFQLRKQFLDPLFEALGWDMANSQGLAPQYRDVIHEDAIKIGPHVKAPDYAFTLHGQRKFFLEAKKPSVNIKADVAPAYQLRRYAWSAKLPLSILSDFEEFAIYDTRIKPAPNDPPAKARTFYCTYDQYAEKWDEIAAIFARDAILKGSFDKYADSAKKKKGTAEVDTAFLEEIERWRDLLARNFALRNPSLNVRDLNFAVQKTIDRLVFLRICEDRGTEDYGRLRTVANGTQTYPRLLELFRAADARYNSGLFHFSKEKGQAEEPDTLTPNLALDDKTLKDIIAHLYYPDSPYEFSVLPADILGSVYERFLGKTIRLTDGHQAKIEEKPEVRKAGGVYYTPSYIVDYIVQNTLGVLLNGRQGRISEPSAANEVSVTTHSPDLSEKGPCLSITDAAKLKVVDPACGSGSFLIVAYQYLLDWHRDHYADNPEKWSKGKNATLYQAKGGEWRLTTAEKKRILLNNIHGVDIDAAAVEVTKLSLLLKVLEGETGEIAQRDFLKERERILPDLSCNIKCGNSLIGPDFYDQPEMDLLDDEARFRVNVFDWKTAFPEVFKQGGFDAVIGNPPYIPPELLTEPEKGYFRRKHLELTRKYDTSVVFILSLLDHLCENGLLSYISSITWQTGKNYAPVRARLLSHSGLRKLINLPFDVFADAYVDTCVYVLSKRPTEQYQIHNFPKKAKIHDLNEIPFKTIPMYLIDQSEWRLALDYGAEKILLKMKAKSFHNLGALTDSTQGLAGNCFENLPTPQGPDVFPYLEKGQALRYYLQQDNVAFTSLNDKPSLARFYAAGPKVLIRRVISRSDRLFATFWEPALVTKKDINPFLFKSAAMAKFTLGLINSSLVSWIYTRTSSIATKDDFRQTTLSELRDLPLRTIDFTNPSDVEKHDRMVSLVDRMLDLVPKRRAEANPQAAAQLDAQIAATDRQIDRLVYDLYGLTDDEIALVEGA
jgi:type I restriction-modification system DNA methylase subunit